MNIFEQVYPFLWVKDNNFDLIKQEIIAIKQCGMNAFCVESRVHSDFCKEQWFDVMDKILIFAKEQEMKVWLLDDKSYPTGSANGSISDDSPLRPYRIKAENIDLEGRKGTIRVLLRTQQDIKQDAEVLRVFRIQLEEDTVVGITDLTSNISDDIVEFEYDGAPSRLVIVMKTRGGWECEERKNYIDVLNPESVNKLIENVYEPHYNRYVKNGEYAGVFEGFFTDESRFANGFTFSEFAYGVHECARTVGILGMAYPWRDGLWDTVSKEVDGIEALEYKHLLALWYDIGDDTSAVRCAYMNTITKEYATNFCGRLSNWCHERGLLYSGHIIEDGGAHRRLACSVGHYFRSQEGADFAAVDVVLHQIKPYYENRHISPICGGYAYPLFFNYSLAKLASSAAAVDDKKNGRALCEIFGAYGWGESIEEMLYLVNHMLVRGINMFIPHAFSSEFPNKDCPPHFYSNGNNPTFDGFTVLGKYMVNMCRRFSGGRAYTPVAVLYDAEAEWSGRPFAEMDYVARGLMREQIDFVFVPEYKLEEYKDYECLIVPYREYLSKSTRQKLKKIKEYKKVYVLGSNEQNELNTVIEALKQDNCASLKLYGEKELIRVMRYKKADQNEYLLHNESSEVRTIQINTDNKDVIVEDMLNEDVSTLSHCNGRVTLVLSAGQAVILKMIAHQDIEFSNKTMVDSVPFKLIADSSEKKQYVAKLIGKQGKQLVVDYEGEFLDISMGDYEVRRITRPAKVLIPDKQEIDVIFTIKDNLATTLKDDLSRFSVLRPVELKKIQVFSE